MRRSLVVSVGAVALLVTSCGGGDDDSDVAAGSTTTTERTGGTAQPPDAGSAADDSEATTPIDTAAPDTAPPDTAPPDTAPPDTAAPDAGNDGDPDEAADEVSIDGLAPGEAIVVVDGRTLRFRRGESIYDVCEMSPDSGFGDAELDAVDAPPDGGPHLRVGVGIEPKYVVIGIPPDIGYVAGSGEEVDPYIENFGIDPQPVTLEADDGFVIGDVEFTEAFTGEVVTGTVAVRCT